MDQDQLKQRALKVLSDNDSGDWTRPARGQYPHQWLWDSCFVAIGLAKADPVRAARELESALRGQWDNGLVPHMVYSRRWPERLEARLWHTETLSPRGIRTSGITQPPVLALAAEAVAEQLTPAARAKFLHRVVPQIARYHDWLYRERDPAGSGLVTLVHPWESGMDDTPPWGEAMRQLQPVPLGLHFIHNVNLLNRDERASDGDAQHMVELLETINDSACDSRALLQTSRVLVRDLTFNCILAAANEALERLAGQAKTAIPREVTAGAKRTRRAIEQLWDDETGQYYNYDVRQGGLIMLPTISTFMPLFAGTASPERVEILRELLIDPTSYGLLHPVPSVPRNSQTFQRHRYWCGPSWINMNWFIIRGLERYGLYEEAQWLRLRTLDVVDQHGFREYFDPISGDGLGAHDFSWTAALVLDLLSKS